MGIYKWNIQYIIGLVQDCGNSSTLAMELLQSCDKPSLKYMGLNTITTQIHVALKNSAHKRLILHGHLYKWMAVDDGCGGDDETVSWNQKKRKLDV